MKLTVLLSAMHLQDENYIDTLNVESDAVVINQCDSVINKSVIHACRSGKEVNVKYVETTERGLSKSRNMAIRTADANDADDVCILCDNDVEYVDGYEQIILKAYENHPDADVVVFFIKRPERSVPVFSSDKRMNYLSVLKIFSPEISFKAANIKGISFNEQFGAGAKYFMGEENILLYDCLKAHKKVYYVPSMIAKVRDEESTWFKGYTKEFFISRGANYAAMSKIFSHVLIWQFALRKTNLYIDNFSLLSAVRIMYQGRREYLDSK